MKLRKKMRGKNENQPGKVQKRKQSIRTFRRRRRRGGTKTLFSPSYHTL